jgi:hypothetical protein
LLYKNIIESEEFSFILKAAATDRQHGISCMACLLFFCLFHYKNGIADMPFQAGAWQFTL